MKQLFASLLALTLLFSAACATSLQPVWTTTDSVRWVDGLDLILERQGNGYTLLDVNGNSVSEEIFGYSTTSLNEEYAAIFSAEDALNTEGVINAAGELVIPCSYGDIKLVRSSGDGYAKVPRPWVLGIKLIEADAENYDYKSFLGDGKYLIDTVDVYNLMTGQMVATLTRSQYADAAVNGYSLSIEDREGKVTAYDADFNLLGEVKYLSSSDYAQYDIVSFRKDGQSGLMDAEENVILPPTYKYLSNSYNDYFRAENDSGTGLIDITGRELVPPQYDSLYGTPAHGYEVVKKDDKYGFVRIDGVETAKPTYATAAMDYSGCSAILTDITGEKRIIAGDGVETPIDSSVYTEFRVIYNSQGMLFSVQKDGKYGVIDWHGEEVVPCTLPTSCTVNSTGHYLTTSEGDTVTVYAITYDDFVLE